MQSSGRTVVVTGASRGIGEAIARAFKDDGARVVGTRTSPAAGGAADSCDEWIVADFSDLAHIRTCADRIRALEPDVLVNNAGINAPAPFTEIRLEQFMAIHQVNVVAPLLLTQAVIPAMARRAWGRVVNVSSVFGKISKAGRAQYSASKFALDGLTVALAAEHSSNGILANSVAPGFIDTEMTRRVLGAAGVEQIVGTVPIGRLGRADEIARLVRWLGSADNTFVTGQNIAIDGGFTRV